MGNVAAEETADDLAGEGCAADDALGMLVRESKGKRRRGREALRQANHCVLRHRGIGRLLRGPEHVHGVVDTAADHGREDHCEISSGLESELPLVKFQNVSEKYEQMRR